MKTVICINDDLSMEAFPYSTIDEALAFCRQLIEFKAALPYLILDGETVVAGPEYFAKVWKSLYNIHILLKLRSRYEPVKPG